MILNSHIWQQTVAPVIPPVAPPVNATGESSAVLTSATRRAQKCGGSGSAEKSGGSGSVPDEASDCPLPALDGIQWEKRTDRPGFAAWRAPQGAKAHRNTKTYLGYVGKRLLALWEALPDDQRRASG